MPSSRIRRRWARTLVSKGAPLPPVTVPIEVSFDFDPIVLVDDDAAALDHHQRVGRAQVDGQVAQLAQPGRVDLQACRPFRGAHGPSDGDAVADLEVRRASLEDTYMALVYEHETGPAGTGSTAVRAFEEDR